MLTAFDAISIQEENVVQNPGVGSSPRGSFGEKAAVKSDLKLVRESVSISVNLTLLVPKLQAV